MNKEVIKSIPVSKMFENHIYKIPIYQRNFAWTDIEIEQLIEDINDCNNKTYFLGNLIVNRIDDNVYEVIDGQQRLTTLYLLEQYLSKNVSPDKALRFEAREKSNHTLLSVSSLNGRSYREVTHLDDERLDKGICDGYKAIENYFVNNAKIIQEEFCKKLDNVYIVQIQAPDGIDLNHYFEIMNTRGEQLELHELAKGQIIEILNSPADKELAAIIWENCSDMNSYVQMNFNKVMREKVFKSDWGDLDDSIQNSKEPLQGFEKIKQKIFSNEESIVTSLSNKEKLCNILLNSEEMECISITTEAEENERFESILSFPNFLLHVNLSIKKIQSDEDGEEETSLDDKKFIESLSWAWKTEENAKKFLYYLLKFRIIFDKYILKREYARKVKEEGTWSLKRLEKSDYAKPVYKPTYTDNDLEESDYNNKLKTLQSCLRVTYTSPRTMHWVSIVLSSILNDANTNLVLVLENYCIQKVSNSGYEGSNGFNFERIVFTYLDYLLYRDGYSYKGQIIIKPMRSDWFFQFRNSIEHFYPQYPVIGDRWQAEPLNSFGNLALITVSGNSQLSNYPPELKSGDSTNYTSIIEQSLKLKIMKEMTKSGNNRWTQEKVKIHKDEMFNILATECKNGK